MPFTAAELEAMRIADAEIEREFNSGYAHNKKHKDIDLWLDDLAKIDALDNRTRSRKRKIAAYKKAYYEAHKDEIAAYQKAYYEAYKDEIAARQKAYRKAHKDEIAAYKKAYREAHKDEIAAYKKAYREAKKRSRAGTAIPSAAR